MNRWDLQLNTGSNLWWGQVFSTPQAYAWAEEMALFSVQKILYPHLVTDQTKDLQNKSGILPRGHQVFIT